MTTFALDREVDTTASDITLERNQDSSPPVLMSVANPRRTTWTGYGKNAADRMPGL